MFVPRALDESSGSSLLLRAFMVYFRCQISAKIRLSAELMFFLRPFSGMMISGIRASWFCDIRGEDSAASWRHLALACISLCRSIATVVHLVGLLLEILA
jgi:hypothetical protein